MIDFDSYLQPGFYTDSNHVDVIAYTERKIKGISDSKEQIIRLYNSIRDEFRYNPYQLILKPYALKASFLLSKNSGYCVEKSNLFAACMRVIGIPSRLCYANVRNHLATEKVENYLKTDLMVFHGFVEIYFNEKWIKLTPVFNKELCDKLGVSVLEFDGENDAVFQESDKDGKPFIHYEKDYGWFSDVPFDLFVAELKEYYPHIFKNKILTDQIIVDF